MSRPAPAPPKKPGEIKQYRVVKEYAAKKSEELNVSEGDILYVMEIPGKSMWKARCGDKVGLVPSNCLEQNTKAIYPLHDAAKRGHLENVRECLKMISVNNLDGSGSTPLHWAAYGGHDKVVEHLLTMKGVIIDAQNKMGDTALHQAAWKGHASTCRILLKQKDCKSRFIRNDMRRTPLELGCNYPDVIEAFNESQGLNW